MKFSWFKKRPSGYLGIDIGTANIKVVQLGLEKKKPTLQNYGVLGTKGRLELVSPIRAKARGLEMMDKEIVIMIKKILEEAKITARNVAVSIPGFASFATVIELPEMPEEEVEKAIPFEAKQYIPVPLSEVVLDWKIIDKKIPGEVKDRKIPTQTKIQVLIVAVPKGTINRYTRVIEFCGLKLETLEIESFSLIRALIGNDPTPVAIVDIGARSTDINIVEASVVREVRNLEVSGIEFTRILSSGMSISFERAEKLKEQKGIIRDEGSQTAELIISAVDRIINEIEQMKNSYLRKYKVKLQKVILSGASARLLGLTSYMAEKLGIDVIIGDPFARITYPEALKPILIELGPSLAVAVGLALRELV